VGLVSLGRCSSDWFGSSRWAGSGGIVYHYLLPSDFLFVLSLGIADLSNDVAFSIAQWLWVASACFIQIGVPGCQQVRLCRIAYPPVFERTLSVTPVNLAIQSNLGHVPWAGRRNITMRFLHFTEALRIKPDYLR
jgi:hypothetical protein